MQGLSRFMKSFAANESGATAIEYGLIAAMIFLVIVASVTAVGESLTDLFTLISGAFG